MGNGLKDTLLRHVLKSWPELWRFPEVLGVLMRSPEASAEELARALVAGIASPRPPAAVFDGLVEAGEYRAASELLDRPGFRAALDKKSVTSMRPTIERARMEARQELDARAAGLHARAKVVGATEDPPEGLEEALSLRRTLAESLIDDWERDIASAESEHAAWVSDQLHEAVARSPAPGPDLEEWRCSVERCIEARRLRTALFLLEGGPQGPPPDEPAAVPRPPEWYWHRSPRQALDWLSDAQPAPPDFGAWRPTPEDNEADALLGALSRIVDRSGHDSEPQFADAEHVQNFAVVLDRFLELDKDREHEVLHKNGGFETRIYALDDPRLPCFALQGAAGVPLWLPLSSASDRPPAYGGEKVALCFSLKNSVRSEGNIVFFDTFSLLRLFADRRHRKVNFLRELGVKLPPLVAIPAESWRIDFRDLTVSDIHSHAAWLFDILNVDVEGPELFDMMVYYSGAKPKLLVLLVRALLEANRERHVAVTPERLLRVWRGPAFRGPAADVLLGPLESDPQLRAILGAALFASERPGGSFDGEDVALVLEVSEAEKANALDRQTLLEELVTLGLLAPSAVPEKFLIPNNGVGHLLFASVPDVEEYIASALRQLG